jgi:hypothetical protein
VIALVGMQATGGPLQVEQLMFIDPLVVGIAVAIVFGIGLATSKPPEEISPFGPPTTYYPPPGAPQPQFPPPDPNNPYSSPHSDQYPPPSR